ncbi:cation-translocating P-type ATPase [Novosphingobium mangrovi (ex Huang et al. 2023)]|uniref:Cation-translocating P-type ATPase n=1 Tax=Novosphingobium mangrovi (ex Huang et al. 2023) TaxID=2976432 RepID=A0ABT2I1N7_9SPHN|nr:cation-translocating P-type ATPase [Novosphingobium mangrovi (ex Huang et al. 2023)]MCT2398722.1 cation-translocating P-type ATPase [Novosphingobium mangrovi (ex Huang et al. 2023)]
MSSNHHTGLSALQARERLERDGPNELPRGERRTPLRIVGEVLREPMLALLLAAGVIYLLLGDMTEALILIAFAGISIALTIVQEARTEKVLEALRDLSAPRALVIRDGETVRVPGREVVRGDLLVLDAGDRIAADALLLEAEHLEADESLLTGESVPVRKRAAHDDEPERAEPGGDDLPQIFAGAIITRGQGVARVSATGAHSRIGEIGRSLAELETEAPRLRRETAAIVRLCAVGGAGVALMVVVLYGLTRGGWLDALLAGIAIGMSLLPEEFPVVLTIFLAMGAWRIAQVGVLTRRTAAIETMGAATVLCTDKTGTLTQNRMTVAELWLPTGELSDCSEGQCDARFLDLIEAGALASAPVPVDPMEVAFHTAANEAGIGGAEGMTLARTHGLRPELLAMSNIWQIDDGDAPYMIAAKGAPEAIARLCRLDDTQRAAMDAAAQAMAARGIRVLGVAGAPVQHEDLDREQEEHPFELLGLAGLSDPLRAGVPEAVAQCRSAGIRVVMITGDYPATARAIAASAGLVDGELMTGDEVQALSDEQLAARVGDVDIFARTMPEQKLRIVSALKAAGEVVAMTGDGVNDAPALKAAHIGVAMGKRGTDVAREASAIVLVEDDFGAIVGAIRVGRRIYDNIRKAMGFIFGVHVPIAVLAILPLLVGSPVIFGPIQIALLEMIIDPVCALVFEAERDESHIMERPPRDPRERLFSAGVIARGVIQGGVAALVLSGLYLLAAERLDMSAQELRTFIFFALVSAVLALVLANRSFSTSFVQALVRHNITFRYVLAFIVTGGTVILTVPAVQRALGFAPLDWMELGIVALTGVGLLVVFEVTKMHRRIRQLHT